MYQNFEYKLERRSTYRIMWCCNKKELFKCRARLVSHGDRILIKNQSHNHPPTFKGDFSHTEGKIATIVKEYEYLQKIPKTKRKIPPKRVRQVDKEEIIISNDDNTIECIIISTDSNSGIQHEFE
ncbi:hypothetical protein JTB14_018863 [Gonioctena quinquepunctata]|nr:hypothetical protein JTB14_018863 [Gonioctena quinquepunctata]